MTYVCNGCHVVLPCLQRILPAGLIVNFGVHLISERSDVGFVVVTAGIISAENATLPMHTKTELVNRAQRWSKGARHKQAPRACRKMDHKCTKKDKSNECNDDEKCGKHEACCFDGCNYHCESR